MKCPKCRKTLILTESRVYETLVEHVCDPNGESLPRPTYVCPRGCFGDDAFWGIDGEIYNPDAKYYRETTDAIGNAFGGLFCFVCKKTLKRSEVHNWVHHDSVGSVCRTHHGVEEWYTELLKRAGEKLIAGSRSET
jgi:hypothetical protein